MVLTPFLTSADAAQIDTLIRQGAKTRELLTGKTTTFVRIDKDTGASINVTSVVALISIALANRDPSETGAGTVGSEARMAGTFEVWAPAAIRRGDQFSWDGATCEVTRVAPAVHGIIKGAFEMIKGVY